ncbi:MAG: hypothetical protein WC602_01480 [archaeon]
MNQNSEKFKWWSDLQHGGMLISPAVLEEFFGDCTVSPSNWEYLSLREHFLSFDLSRKRASDRLVPPESIYQWLDYVFVKFLKYPEANWLKTPQIHSQFVLTNILREQIKPNRLLFRCKEDTEPVLAVMVDPSPRIGFGKSRKNFGKLLEYLRAKRCKLGLLTNGVQFRLCYAGLDHESWAEWDASAWFESAENLPQLSGFSMLLGNGGFEARDGFDFPLLNAIENSRSRQGELSSILGEQVRKSLEILLGEFSKIRQKYPNFTEPVSLNPDGSTLAESGVLSAIFQAAVRIIMRWVVILFAEARDLLPRSNELYHRHYGVEGLFELLRKAKSVETTDFMEENASGWIRLLSLFHLIYSGSNSPDIPIPHYGGELFESGDLHHSDPVKRALALFESPRFQLSNQSLMTILENLKYGKMKIRQGRSSRWVNGPVDFSELRTEFIGMIYEGILDYELKAAPEPMILLNVGLQPILPLSVVESLNEKQIKDLLTNLKDKKEDTGEGEEVEIEIDSAMEETEANDTDEDENESVEISEEEPITDINSPAEQRAQNWAEKAVLALGWVKKPKKPEDEYIYQINLQKRARGLVKEVYRNGDYYISRWGGTRKGTGTFYTRPQLAVPTVRRTLEPLCYVEKEIEFVATKIIEPGQIAEPTAEYGKQRFPKTPEDILQIKVCDPSCGSGSFLVAALNYLTETLYESLCYHTNLESLTDYRRKTLPLGIILESPEPEDTLPTPPDDEHFRELTIARLKRYVVENCIYGVDLNPTAVELARLSLWIETMDSKLPFEFLDHKIKVGNSLVGAWLDTFMEYPLAAWLKEGGDKTHSNGVNYQKETWTKAIKERFNSIVKPEMVELILQRAGVLHFEFPGEPIHPVQSHQEIRELFRELHQLPPSMFGEEQKQEIYYEKILKNENYQRLKERMNLWCALWFWNGDEIAQAPTPKTFYQPSPAAVEITDRIAREYRFFHWEIEFPDVFNPDRQGFDAVLGNPPWEISKPNSKEFFSNLDPIYRTYGKQEALREQERLFESNPAIEYEWLGYYAYFKAMSNFAKYAAHPFGDSIQEEDYTISLTRGTASQRLHSEWQKLRLQNQGYADAEHPFRHQGSADINTYKMFLEFCHALLKKHGRLGMIVPSGIYSDKGTRGLRNLFIDRCRWDWLYSFENRQKVFDIDSRFKFNPVIVEKGGTTEQVQTAFMRHELKDWENGEGVTPYEKAQIRKFSPNNLAFLEITSQRDAHIIEKIYNHSVLLGDQTENGWKLEYNREFDMTNDSKYFIKRDKLEVQGYRPDPYGRWVNDNGEMALPLYQGVMIHQFNFSAASHQSGSGNITKWSDQSWIDKKVRSKYYISSDTYNPFNSFYKVILRIQARSTDLRTLISAVIPNSPCGNSLLVLGKSKGISKVLTLPIYLNSFVVDYIIRSRLGGANINNFYLDEIPISKKELPKILINLIANLNIPNPVFSMVWLLLKHRFNISYQRNLWALTPHERLRLRCILDAVIAELYGLDYVDFAWILRDDPSDPKGFWRVDKEKPKELRHTTLALAAFRRLKDVGLDAFIAEDWQFPPEIAAQLGPRFYDWQLAGTPEESWAECEYHAKQILGEEGYTRFMAEMKGEKPAEVREEMAKYGEKNDKLKLF